MWLLTQSWSAQLAACCSGISAVLMWLLREQGGSLASAILLWGWLGLRVTGDRGRCRSALSYLMGC